MTDDSLSAFPRVWRKNDAAPNAALLPEEDITKSAPTTKKLGAYPSQEYLVVRCCPSLLKRSSFNRTPLRMETRRPPKP